MLCQLEGATLGSQKRKKLTYWSTLFFLTQRHFPSYSDVDISFHVWMFFSPSAALPEFIFLILPIYSFLSSFKYFHLPAGTQFSEINHEKKKSQHPTELQRICATHRCSHNFSIFILFVLLFVQVLSLSWQGISNLQIQFFNFFPVYWAKYIQLYCFASHDWWWTFGEIYLSLGLQKCWLITEYN